MGMDWPYAPDDDADNPIVELERWANSVYQNTFDTPVGGLFTSLAVEIVERARSGMHGVESFVIAYHESIGEVPITRSGTEQIRINQRNER